MVQPFSPPLGSRLVCVPPKAGNFRSALCAKKKRQIRRTWKKFFRSTNIELVGYPNKGITSEEHSQLNCGSITPRTNNSNLATFAQQLSSYCQYLHSAIISSRITNHHPLKCQQGMPFSISVAHLLLLFHLLFHLTPCVERDL